MPEWCPGSSGCTKKSETPIITSRKTDLRHEPLGASGEIYSDMADRRERRGIPRMNIDTVRGCKTENFYKLPDVAAVEAQEDAPTEQDQR